MKKFYFTFGTDPEYPFRGGWVEVEARTLKEAVGVFKALYPNRPDSNLLNCADWYTEDEFLETDMYQAGNDGARCHMKIRLDVEKVMEAVKNI